MASKVLRRYTNLICSRMLPAAMAKSRARTATKVASVHSTLRPKSPPAAMSCAGPRQVADFYAMRLRKNVEFGRRFAEVDGIADLIGLQHEYVRDMLLDYASSFWSFSGMAGFGFMACRPPNVWTAR